MTDSGVVNPSCLTAHMDKPFNLQAHVAVSLVFASGSFLSFVRFFLWFIRRARANMSSLASFSRGCTDTQVITKPVPELQRSSQGRPNKQASLAPLFMRWGLHRGNWTFRQSPAGARWAHSAHASPCNKTTASPRAPSAFISQSWKSGEEGRERVREECSGERGQCDNKFLTAVQFVLALSIGFRLMMWPGQMAASLLSYLDTWILFFNTNSFCLI